MSHAKGTLCLFLSLLIGLSGCGGSEKTAPPVIKRKAAPAAVAKKPTPKPQKKTRPRKNRPTKKTPKEALDPDAFYVLKTPPQGERTVIIKDKKILDANDTFVVVQPAAEMDSSSFRITAVPQTPQHGLNPQFQIPQGYEVIEDAGYTENGIPKRIHDIATNMEMVFVPAGLAIRGDNDQSIKNNSPQHTVDLPPFYIDVTEVTLEAYQLFAGQVGKRPARTPSNNASKDRSLPAVGLNWGEAQRYAKKYGKQLPTEAEWEKAARGTKGFQYPWGNSRPVWHKARRPGEITPVLQYKHDISPYAAIGLAGNAKEWCRDWYDPNIYQRLARKNEVILSPRGATSGGRQKLRIVRGGGDNWSVTFREGVPMNSRSNQIGFRTVLYVHVPGED